MRKLLLASAAMLGATSGIATAQQPQPAAASMMMQPTQGNYALPWTQGPTTNNNNNGYGQPNTYQGAAAYGKNAVPTPGTVVIRFNGRVQTDMMAAWSTNHQVPGFKTNPVSFATYLRLYPGVDGMAANGLRYGAAAEIRQNYPGSTAQPTPANGSGVAGTVGGAAPSPGTYISGQTLWLRNVFAYIAADNFGMVRLGYGNGVIDMLNPGIFSATGWDGGVGSLNGTLHQTEGVIGANVVPYTLQGSGSEQGNVKLVYLSPQIFGLDVGIQYAPSMGNSFSNCNTAGPTCVTTTTGNDPTRWFNQVAVGARWQGVFGPVSVGAYGVYETAGKESFNGAPVLSGRGVVGTRYDNLAFISAGTYVLFESPIGQFTASAEYLGGATNGPLIMRPSGGINQNQLLTGLVYRNGPVTLGSQFNFLNSQGAAALTGTSQRREFAMAAGGTYTLAPGLFVYAEYQYAYRHQGGFDFVNGAVSTGTGTPGTVGWRAGATRDSHGQCLIVGTSVNW